VTSKMLATSRDQHAAVGDRDDPSIAAYTELRSEMRLGSTLKTSRRR
jgi:hypothetical protein